MSYFNPRISVFLAMALFLAGTAHSFAAGKKKPASNPPPRVVQGLDGKRIVALRPLPDIQIELPNQDLENFGRNYRDVLVRKLMESQRFLEGDSLGKKEGTAGMFSMTRSLLSKPRYDWASTYVPTATLSVEVEAMNFTTGSRGDRSFYGFDPRFKTPFNDGVSGRTNEFPLRTVSFEPNWFDRTFDAKGKAPINSLTGLDLGEGFRIDALFAWLAVKYAKYESHLDLKLTIDAPLAGVHETRLVQVKGEGFFYDVAGAYKGYSAGIRLARMDAMKKALDRAIEGSFQAVDRAVAPLPLAARIDHVLAEDGTLLLGTGFNAEVKPGVRYRLADHPEVVLEVIEAYPAGSRAQLVSGDPALAREGQLLIQEKEGYPALSRATLAQRLSQARRDDGPSRVETIELPWQNFSKLEFDDGMIPEINIALAILKSVVEAALLPYRIWRYSMYDREYQPEPDWRKNEFPDTSKDWERKSPGQEITRKYASWRDRMLGEPWARQIGLARVPPVPARLAREPAPVIAVIDSGVDYNHPAIHPQLWLNPAPNTDTRSESDRYGWDFVSGDGRPADDGYHGTQVASLITAVAPQARILPLKVFNPWGITSSAAMYGAFKYAVDHGARIIVCGWATRQASEAIELGVAYARERGVLVVAAAGDRGDDLAHVAAYPAALAERYDNVLTVAAVDDKDRLVKKSGRHSNYGARFVRIAAPGQDVAVAEPRKRESKDTSTGLAAALVAGAAARVPGRDYSEIERELLSGAARVPSLVDGVEEGRRLRLVE